MPSSNINNFMIERIDDNYLLIDNIWINIK